MPLIVALDTTARAGNLALISDGRLNCGILLAGGVHHDSAVFPALWDLLSDAGVDIGEVDAFAAAAGPGTFTGVRTGLTIVKALGEALSRPVFAVSCLESLCLFSPRLTKAALIDARRGMIYGRYESPGEATAEVLGPLGDWLGKLHPVPDCVVVRDPVLTTQVSQIVPSAEILVQAEGLAGEVGVIAHQRYLRGERPDPAAADAFYLRRADADLKWRDLNDSSVGAAATFGVPPLR